MTGKALFLLFKCFSVFFTVTWPRYSLSWPFSCWQFDSLTIYRHIHSISSLPLTVWVYIYVFHWILKQIFNWTLALFRYLFKYLAFFVDYLFEHLSPPLPPKDNILDFNKYSTTDCVGINICLFCIFYKYIKKYLIENHQLLRALRPARTRRGSLEGFALWQYRVQTDPYPSCSFFSLY